MANQQITGILANACGKPFNGQLRLRRLDGNALQQGWVEINFINGVVPEWMRLIPGNYEVVYRSSKPDGLLPSETWKLGEFNYLDINKIRNKFLEKPLLEKQAEVISRLTKEIKKLKNTQKNKQRPSEEEKTASNSTKKVNPDNRKSTDYTP